MDVTFKHKDREIRAPGYFAADGDAANTSASSGNKWRGGMSHGLECSYILDHIPIWVMVNGLFTLRNGQRINISHKCQPNYHKGYSQGAERFM